MDNVGMVTNTERRTATGKTHLAASRASNQYERIRSSEIAA